MLSHLFMQGAAGFTYVHVNDLTCDGGDEVNYRQREPGVILFHLLIFVRFVFREDHFASPTPQGLGRLQLGAGKMFSSWYEMRGSLNHLTQSRYPCGRSF